jgi:hypothetical protein
MAVLSSRRVAGDAAPPPPPPPPPPPQVAAIAFPYARLDAVAGLASQQPSFLRSRQEAHLGAAAGTARQLLRQQCGRGQRQPGRRGAPRRRRRRSRAARCARGRSDRGMNREGGEASSFNLESLLGAASCGYERHGGGGPASIKADARWHGQGSLAVRLEAAGAHARAPLACQRALRGDGAARAAQAAQAAQPDTAAPRSGPPPRVVARDGAGSSAGPERSRAYAQACGTCERGSGYRDIHWQRTS